MVGSTMPQTRQIEKSSAPAFSAFIYVPDMHPGFAPCRVPLSVAFFHPGLPGVEESIPDHAQGRLLYHPAIYPFDPLAARAVLREMLSIGERMDAGLRSGGASGLETPELAALQLFPDGSEMDREIQMAFASLDGAAHQGRKDGTEDGAEDSEGQDAAAHDGQPMTPSDVGFLERARVAAQKTLLLAWDLEERLEEIYRLQEEVAASGQSLSRLLGEGQSQEQMLDAMLTAFAHYGGSANGQEAQGVSRPDWKITLGAMAPFLPKGARLFSCHEIMGAELFERGLLHALPDSDDPVLRAFPKPLYAVNAPLWRILGRSAPPEDKPWLLETVLLYMSLPA
ncbi:hypothetical protein LJC23_00475 [Desulfovibrio sp. OttesenSCG-928-I05]|nr:hypothetical protein [Desulfovibrio sp. OttesenSCG-928-I05]